MAGLWAQHRSNTGESQLLVAVCPGTGISRDADVTVPRFIGAKFVGQIADASGTEHWAGHLIYGFDGVCGWFAGFHRRLDHGFLLSEIKKP